VRYSKSITLCEHAELPRAIKVVVFTIKQGKEVPLLVAYWCCLSKNVQTFPGFTSLPLLLIKSTAALSKKFLDWLSLTFDCYTWRIKLSSDEIRKIMAWSLAETKSMTLLGGIKILFVCVCVCVCVRVRAHDCY